MDTPAFKPDRNQIVAVIAMLGAVFLFATGDLLWGFVMIGVAALFSIGGLFWGAHQQDRADAAAMHARDPSGANKD